MKLKTCDNCKKEGPLWQGRTKTKPGLCKSCAGKAKSLITPELSDLINEGQFALLKVKNSINKVSDKQKKINAAYKILRDDFMARNPECQGKLSGCTFKATECHHSLGRGKNEMLDQSTYISLCHSCHHIVENNRELAQQLKLSGKRLNKR